MTDVEIFEAWLTERRYSPSTIERSLDMLRALERGVDAPWMEAGCKRIRECFPGTHALHQGAVALLVKLAAQKKSRAFHGRVGRMKRKVDGLDDAAWRRLCAAITRAASRDHPPAVVLELMTATGMRIGDVLRITSEQLRQGAKTGKYALMVKGDKPVIFLYKLAPQTWDRLQAVVKAHAPNVATWVCPGGDGTALPGHGAYQKVKRCLHKLCREAGIEERMFLHRIRKTVGEQIYAATGDMMAVRDALGHEDVATSQRYVNRHHVDRVAEAHALRNKMFATGVKKE